ncbi:thermonuclease family protein [Neptuniibacter halophilus]|uniref:thermonuclease family protein n=1 Tax=Neptuniibacter halophilus TaxID=651666 RepID=UPI0025722E5D|nr:thermonuclease family protein [Neptuniibacter halophilus]
MRILKKALPLWGAFFVALSLPAEARCLPDQALLPVQIESVVDGDTVHLQDGRKVRLIGLNAPEAGSEDRPAEFGAELATKRLRELLQSADVKMSLETQPRDHYGRWLGHLWVEGQSVAEQLLREGLAFYIAIPPNLKYSACLQQAESVAVGKRVGLWRDTIWHEAAALEGISAGFKLVQGRVSRVREIRSGWIVELDHRLAIRLSSEQAVMLDPKYLTGRRIRVRGWLRPRQPRAPKHFMPWFINLNHSSHLQLFP